MHHDLATRENIANHVAADDDDVGLNLRFNPCAWVDDKRVPRKDLALEGTANTNGSFEGESPFKDAP